MGKYRSFSNSGASSDSLIEMLLYIDTGPDGLCWSLPHKDDWFYVIVFLLFALEGEG
jgi:hypothetical protein